jgi:hypothetical protein
VRIVGRHVVDPDPAAPRLRAREQGRLDLAVARGLSHDLLLTGDRAEIDAVMRRYAEDAVVRLLG